MTEASCAFLYISVGVVNLLGFSLGIAFAWSTPVLPMLQSNNTFINPLGRPTTPSEDSLIASLVCLGASFGPFIAAYCSEKFGRKKSLLAVAFPMLVSHGIAMFADQVWQLYVARILIGIGVGIIFSTVPLYVGEVAQNNNRGSLGCVMGLQCVLGILFCYSVGPYVSIRTFGMICLVPLIMFVVTFGAFIPESPYYLLYTGKEHEAKESLSKLRPKGHNIDKELLEMSKTIQDSIKEKFKPSSLYKSPNLRKGLLISCGLMFCQQLSGVNVMISYMQSIFDATGSSIPSDISVIIIGTIQCLVVLLSTQLIDRLGRRILVLFACVGNCLSLSTLGLYFWLKSNGFEIVQDLWWLPVVSLVFFMFCYNTGLCALPFAIMGELFPQSAKALASLLTTFCCVFLAFLTTIFFPHMALAIGMAMSFWLFAIAQALGFVYCYILVPETKGKSFQEIQDMLSSKK